jgi:predicted DNA-binding transcriptional regulator YafY
MRQQVAGNGHRRNMPSFSKALLRDINKIHFIQEMEGRAKKPKKPPIQPGLLYAGRQIKLAIREAALRHHQVVITYKKITTGETKTYRCAPYEWKHRTLKIGRVMVLYAYDMIDRHIKSFVARNIDNVAIMGNTFRPRWPVKII